MFQLNFKIPYFSHQDDMSQMNNNFFFFLLEYIYEI